MKRLLRHMLIIGLAQLATACFPVLFTTHEFRLELDRDQDLAVLELNTLNVFPQSDEGKKLTEGVDFVARVARGERVFIMLHPTEEVDLENILVEAAELWDVETDLEREGVEFLEAIKVVEARVESSDGGHVDLYQRVEIPNVERGIELLNALIWESVLRDASESRPRFYGFPPADFAVAIAEAKAQVDWVLLDERGLVVRLPVSSRTIWAAVQEGMDDGLSDAMRLAGGEATDFSELIFTYSHLEYLSRLAWDVQVESDHLVVHFGGPDGVLQTDWQLENVLKFMSTPGVLEEERVSARVQLLNQLEAMGIALSVEYLAPE